MSKSPRHKAAFALALFSIAAFAFYAFAEKNGPDAGKFVYVEGTARKQVSGSEGWLKVESGMGFGIGDSIKTRDDGRLEFAIAAEGTFRIGNSTIAYIAEDQSNRYAIPELVWGDLWARFYHDDDNSSAKRLILPTVEVAGDSAIARFISGEDCTSEIKVYGGMLWIDTRMKPPGEAKAETDKKKLRPCDEVQAVSDSTSPKWPIELSAGQRMILSSRGQIVFHGAFSLEDPDESTDWVRWNKSRDLTK